MTDTPANTTTAAADSDRVPRHSLIDRLYHWLMAIAVFALMGSAFLPILGIKFQWIEIHWISGVVLAVLVLIHIVRALFFQDWRQMMIWPSDIRDIFRGLLATFSATATLPARPGKYNPLQKLYHLGIAAVLLAVIVSGILMLFKIDTPLWQRNPYIFSNDTWGWIYAVHGIGAMVMITMIMIHVYFALRPDEFYLTKSMFRGWITRKEYRDHHDTDQWRV